LPLLVASGLLACSAPRPVPRPVAAVPLPVPARGCGKPHGAVGERRLKVGGRTGLFIVSVPSSYDASHHYPLGFAFHGRNRNHVNCQQGDCAGVQSVMGEHAVLVYPQSLREPLDREDGGWEWPTERDDNARFVEAVWSQVQDEFCVDDERTFLAGSSSGGAFAHWLACLHGDRLLAVAAVSGGWPDATTCTGTPAALVLHGIDDPHVPIARGILARESYQQRSGCSASTAPNLDGMHAEVRKARDATPKVETAECVDYQGCAAHQPVRWCEHSYGGYDGSTHGWPPVGGQLIWDFVSKL